MAPSWKVVKKKLAAEALTSGGNGPIALCEECSGPFVRARETQRFCCEQHQRNAANRRYRSRRAETARCKRCGAPFERTATSQRKQVFWAARCQRLYRSADYRQGPAIWAPLEAYRGGNGPATVDRGTVEVTTPGSVRLHNSGTALPGQH